MTERLSRQQLKEDPLLKSTGEAVDFARHHGRILIGSFAGLVILVLAVVVIRGATNRSADRASGMLAEARADISHGALEPGAARLQDILQTMGGTKAGKMALLLMGDIRYSQGRFQEARESYEQAVKAFGKDPVLGDTARRSLAATLENLSQNAEAAKIYQVLADHAGTESLRAEMLLGVARNYLKSGQQDQAIALYENLSKNPSNPTAAQEAALRLAEIRALSEG